MGLCISFLAKGGVAGIHGRDRKAMSSDGGDGILGAEDDLL